MPDYSALRRKSDTISCSHKALLLVFFMVAVCFQIWNNAVSSNFSLSHTFALTNLEVPIFASTVPSAIPSAHSTGIISCDQVYHEIYSREHWIDDNKGRKPLSKRLIDHSAHLFLSREGGIKTADITSGQTMKLLLRERSLSSEKQHDNKDGDSTVPIVIEVGASIGYNSLLSASYNHKVFAMESNPSNLARICDSIHFNGKTNHPDTMSLSPSLSDFNSLIHLYPTRRAVDDLARDLGWLGDTNNKGNKTNNKVEINVLKISNTDLHVDDLMGARQLLSSPGMVRNVLLEYKNPVLNSMDVLWNAGFVLVEDGQEGRRKMLSLEQSKEAVGALVPPKQLWLRRYSLPLSDQLSLVSSSNRASKSLHLNQNTARTRKSLYSSNSDSVSSIWWEKISSSNSRPSEKDVFLGGHTPCAKVHQNIENGIWLDPNKGQYYVRRLESEPHFLISLHNSTYDSMRFSSIYNKGEYYEGEVIPRFNKILAEGQKMYKNSAETGIYPIMIDVGMNIGYYSLKCASRGHAVFAFEINPANILRMCESVHWNTIVDETTGHLLPMSKPLAPIQLYRNGVSDQDGVTLKVDIPDNPGAATIEPIIDANWNNLTTSLRLTYTSTITLDKFAEDRGWFGRDDILINILKVDVEGHEKFVIEGAKRLLKSGMVKNLLVEFRTETKEKLPLLWDAGYVLVDDPYIHPKGSNKNPSGTPRMMSLEESQKFLEPWETPWFKDFWFRLESFPLLEQN